MIEGLGLPQKAKLESNLESALLVFVKEQLGVS